MEAFRGSAQADQRSYLDDAGAHYSGDHASLASSDGSQYDPGLTPDMSPEMSRSTVFEAPGASGADAGYLHKANGRGLRVSDSGNYGLQPSPQRSSLSETSELSTAVEEHVRQSIAELEARLASLLQGVTEDLATDIGREQQHLMLMQDQMDKQGQIMLKELLEVNKKMEQEKTQRSFVQRSVRESRELLHMQIQKQAKELELLRMKLSDLETPWLMRMIKGLYGAMWGCTTRGAVATAQQYQHTVQQAHEMQAQKDQPLSEAEPMTS
ncbi:hypothetical protein WJX72_005715 [[Myrmecia] bisecta]|uniref:Uncharacterized protein n=1 Tax=[Myrmecia] bisecta TaxID=41462 RepID=A0AAW1PXC4_9CHLO